MSIMSGYVAARAEMLASERESVKQERREAVFKLVEPKSHWKDEIHAFIPAATWRAMALDMREVQDAVSFFTATEAHFTAISHEGLFCGYVVRADGYRKGPAGDH